MHSDDLPNRLQKYKSATQQKHNRVVKDRLIKSFYCIIRSLPSHVAQWEKQQEHCFKYQKKRKKREKHFIKLFRGARLVVHDKKVIIEFLTK